MLNKILKLGLLIIFTCGVAAAQTGEPDVVTCETGKVKTLKVKNLAGASVGNINTAYIEDHRGDEITIFGAAPGETTLELTSRDGRKDTLTLRVLPKGAPVANEPGAVTMAIGKPVKEAAPVGAAPAKEEVAPPTPTTVPTSVTPHIERPRPRSSASRLQISIEPYFLSDTEHYPVVNVENAEDHEQSAQPLNNQEHDHEIEFATVRRSVKVLPLSLRYDLSSRNALTVVLPFIQRVDEITLGKDKRKARAQGLGDIQVSFERLFPRLRGSAWDGTFELNASLPTGKSIYSVGENKNPLGLGHYEFGSQVGVRRIFDPLAVNASLGLYYTLPRTANDMKIRLGLGHTLQTGFAYALSDRWALSEQLIYSRRPNVFLNSPTDVQVYKSEQSYLTHGLIFNPRDGSHVFRMSFSLGLTPTSTDRGFGVSYIYQRRAPVAKSN